MKYVTFILGLLLIFSCAHVPGTSSPLNVDGTWKGMWDNSKVKKGQPPELFILKLKSDGNSITGTGCNATLNPDKWYDLKDIKRKGNTLFFSATPAAGLTLKCEAQVEGDKMNMTFKWGTLGLASDSFDLEREKL